MTWGRLCAPFTFLEKHHVINTALMCIADIDECEDDGICGRHSKCHNTIGSFYCSCQRDYTASSGTSRFQDRSKVECKGEYSWYSGIYFLNIQNVWICYSNLGFASVHHFTFQKLFILEWFRIILGICLSTLNTQACKRLFTHGTMIFFCKS